MELQQLQNFTASVIGESISLILNKENLIERYILICGGGRKNKILLKKIKNNLIQISI